MKKAVNATTFVALALAASVTYNIVQHQRAKGIRPEDQKQENTAVQTVATQDKILDANAAAGAALNSATESASAAQRITAITFRSASYDKNNDELDISFTTPNSFQYNLPKNAIDFSPEVDNISYYTRGSTISVSGGFKPGVTYRVRVKKGLADRSGKATLENDAVFDFTMPELAEKFSFLTDGSVFPITEKTVEFPYSARNIRKLDVKLYRAFDNNLINMSTNSYSYYWDDRADTSNMLMVGEKTVELSDARNETVNHLLDINDILVVNDSNSNTTRLFSATPGYYVLEVSYERQSNWGDYTYRETRYRKFMLTDFALVAATVSDPAGGIVLFARRISDGAPVADAEIELTSDKNQLLAKGKTDASGKVVFHVSQRSINKLHEGENDSNFLNRTGQFGDIYSATIRKGKEFAWFPLDLYTGKTDLTPRAFAFSERGIVRPGESFLAAAFIRNQTDAELEIGHETADASGKEGKNKMGSLISLDKVPVTLTVVAPDGKEIFSKQLTPDKNGFVSSEVRIPDNAASGYYSFRFGVAKRTWGESHIQVGTYVPDRIRTKLEHGDLPAGPTALNEPLQAVLSADYYFGTPVPSASGRVYFDCFANGKRPDHWKDWTVGDDSRFNFDEYNAALLLSNGKTNLSLPSFKSRGMSFDPVRVVLQASVKEPGGRSVTASDNFTLYPTDWFIGLKEKEGADRECVLDLALLTPEQGKAAALDDGRDIKFTVYHRSWDYVLVQEGDGYRRRWKETVSEVEGASKTFTVPQNADLAAFTSQISFDLPSGCYDIVAEYGNDIRTKINVWHSAGESGRRTGDPSGLVFKTDAKYYTPGQTAKLTFTSPVAGEAFVAMGGIKLDSSSTVQVKAGENTIEAKIPDDCLNGIFHVGVFVVGKQDGEYMRASGDATLKLDHSAAHKLNVAIELPGIVRPETEADVTVSLSTLDGTPVSGQVCLFAVDEGVLALTGFKTPDIYKFFLQADDSFISMSETYSRLFPNLKIRPDGTIGGGDDAAAKSALSASLVKMKDTVRLVVPAVAVSNGTGKVKVKIPDHTGSLRFMAVASSPDAVGSGDREIIVRSPVSLTVSAPRVLAPGDEAVISVRAFNHDANNGAVDFKLALPDTLQVMGDLPRIDALKAGETKDVSFRVKALDKAAEGTLAATLSVGAESRTEKTYLTVRPATPPQTVSTFAIVKPDQTLTVDPAAGFLSVDGAKLSVSSSPAVGVTGALEWLNEYPYGCLEQTTSGAFPFLSSAALVKAGLLDAEVAKTMEPKVPAAYARILNMMAGDGAFSMWPDVRKEWPEGTVYAAHFIFEAKAAKRITVDAAVERSIVAYLLRLANSAGTYKPELRAYAAYVLAAAGNKDFVIPARNILAGSKPGFASFLASAALVRGGHAGEGAESLRAALADPTWLYQTSQLVGITDTTSRAGMVLSILMKCDPKGSEAAAAELASFLAGRIRKDGECWGTTQANAWASMGLAAFAEYDPPADPSGVMTAADRTRHELAGKVLNRFELATAGANTVSNTGKSNLYVRTVVSGVPKHVKASAGQIRLKREFFDENGNPVSSLNHGELAYVRITADSPDVVENIVISDLLPAGLEIEDDELATRMNTAGRIPSKLLIKDRQQFSRTEKRDDRFLVFGTLYGSAYAIYTVRAVTPGKFVVPALHAEAMYDPDMNGTFIPAAGEDVFEVK